MATSSEIDLRDGDGSLIRLISDFTQRGTKGAHPRAGGLAWAPLVLDGFDDGQLRARFQTDQNELVWVVEVALGSKSKRTQLRYAMSAQDLGDLHQDWLRCTQKLRTFAEVHLRADLHLLVGGYVPAGGRSITRIDSRGWSYRHN